MSSFVTVPNLPEKRISLAAAGNYPEIISALHNTGISTLSFESNALPKEISRHLDMLLCHTGENEIFLAPEISPDPRLAEGATVRHTAPLGDTYPHDVMLNLAVSRDFFVFNPKTADTALREALSLSGRRAIPVKQGYAKCSLCMVTENAVITEDPSIYEALKNTDIHTLLISKGDIYLSDTHCGFFGGSTGKISSRTLAVTGSLSTHRDGEKIRGFCKKHGVEILELTQGKIIDIGGIIPLKEQR